MAEFSGLWTTTGTPAGDQQVSYTQAQLTVAFQVLAGCSKWLGVASNYRNSLVPSDGGFELANIATGGAVVDGKYYDNTAVVGVTVDSAVGGGNTRIDRVVIRADWAAFTVRVYLIAGVDAASPTVPSITQSSGTTYDILIAQVLVDTAGNITITDEREFAMPKVDDSTIEVSSSGALKVLTDGITATEIATATITATQMAANSVDSSELVNGSVDDSHIAANTILAGSIAPDAVGSSELANNAVDTNAIVNLAVTEGKIATNAITNSKIGTGAVDTDELATDSVTAAKIGVNQVGTSEIQALAVTNAQIAANTITASQINSNAITASEMSPNVIDDTHIEHRVPKLQKREGGSATDWAQSGTTTYTPTDVQIQCGEASIVGSVSGGAFGSVAITFPQAFTYKPLMWATFDTSFNQSNSTVHIGSVTTTGCTIIISNDSAATQIYTVDWLAIGPG